MTYKAKFIRAYIKDLKNMPTQAQKQIKEKVTAKLLRINVMFVAWRETLLFTSSKGYKYGM
jgi:mRNA-degrading endonuclease RelE of RelBE toxin-antitoxin system